MSELMLPPTWAVLLTALTSCFQARSYLTFQWLTLGWVQCQGRRTVTEVALASGAVGERHSSVFHRFFSRASWALDTLGQVLFTLAWQWVPAGQRQARVGPRLRAARTAHAQHQQVTKLELLREMVDLLAGWAGERTVYLVVDSADAGRTVLEDRPANVHVISRLRWDAALYAP